MSKTLLALAGATSITVFLLTAPPAEARCSACSAGANVVVGVATGTTLGTAIANAFFHGSVGAILAMRGLRRRRQSS
jgi:hypothetical protein